MEELRYQPRTPARQTIKTAKRLRSVALSTLVCLTGAGVLFSVSSSGVTGDRCVASMLDQLLPRRSASALPG